MNASDPLARLLCRLSTLDAGSIPSAVVEKLLAAGWHDLEGDHGGMTADKLLGRMENPVWQPPLLTFRIERHGAVVMGSGRAEVQEWAVDLDRRTASLVKVTHRQLRPAQARLDLHPVAWELAEAILAGRQDERLKWKGDSRVRLLIGKVLPERSAVKQTLSSRRRRLRETLARLLAPAGWVVVRANVFQKVEDGGCLVKQYLDGGC